MIKRSCWGLSYRFVYYLGVKLYAKHGQVDWDEITLGDFLDVLDWKTRAHL